MVVEAGAAATSAEGGGEEIMGDTKTGMSRFVPLSFCYPCRIITGGNGDVFDGYLPSRRLPDLLRRPAGRAWATLPGWHLSELAFQAYEPWE